MLHPHDHYPVHSPPSRSHYDPNQPRVPRGHPDGGQWTSGGYRPLSELAATRISKDGGPRSNADERGHPLWPLSMLGKLDLPLDASWRSDLNFRDSDVLVRLAAISWWDKRNRTFGQLELPLEVGGGMGAPRGTLRIPLPFRQRSRSETAGVLRTSKGDFEVVSGTGGPAASIPKGVLPNFDGLVRLHAEGQAVAHMISEGIAEGTLYLNNQRICLRCEKFLRFALPRHGLKLNVVLPNGITRTFGTKP